MASPQSMLTAFQEGQIRQRDILKGLESLDDEQDIPNNFYLVFKDCLKLDLEEFLTSKPAFLPHYYRAIISAHRIDLFQKTKRYFPIDGTFFLEKIGLDLIDTENVSIFMELLPDGVIRDKHILRYAKNLLSGAILKSHIPIVLWLKDKCLINLNGLKWTGATVRPEEAIEVMEAAEYEPTFQSMEDIFFGSENISFSWQIADWLNSHIGDNDLELFLSMAMSRCEDKEDPELQKITLWVLSKM